MSISITLCGILLALVVPNFTRVTEQHRVDSAALNLHSIWCAQRVYWLENRTYTDSLTDLKDMGLIDAKLLGTTGGFGYSIADADATEFTVEATRSGSGTWSGTLEITEDGEVTGFISKGAVVLTPPDI
jgi:hypothetical protein